MRSHNTLFRKAVAISLFLALFACFFMSAEASAKISAYVKSDSATVYTNAWLSTPLGKLNKLTVVSVLEYGGGVVKISCNGHTCYARAADFATVESIAKKAYINADCRMYSKASFTSSYSTLKKGAEVNVLAANRLCAFVERDGSVGYIEIKYISSAPEQPKPEALVIDYEKYKAQVASEKMNVYKSASVQSKRLGALSKGCAFNVLARCNGWAYIELNGYNGFCLLSDIQKYVEDPHAYLTNEKLSNEQIIYAFLMKELNFSSAAACGVLANIKYESGYRPDATGDNGRSYGICQWFAARCTRMKNYCEKNNYDCQTLAGQLWFLKYELEKHYPSVLRYMLNSVENTSDGAYDAGWYWCYHFEGPANRASVAVTRGNYAKNTVWSRYNG